MRGKTETCECGHAKSHHWPSKGKPMHRKTPLCTCTRYAPNAQTLQDEKRTP